MQPPGKAAPKHPISVHWSAEDGAWIADVPALAYCTAQTGQKHRARIACGVIR